MRRFHHEFQVNAPVERVAEFHRSTQALKSLTPPPLFISFNHIDPLGEGSRADFTMWLGPIPIRWIAIHSDVNLMGGFTDTQIEGPFQTWVHRHSFERINGNSTMVIDTIDGQPSNHPFWGLVSRFMWYTLPILFFYRARQTRKAVEGR
jgi:ligand-binding SRPBCC domain-containing protein